MFLKFVVRALFWIWVSFFISINSFANESTKNSFEEYYDLIYQIKVVAKKAGGKSSIGSGFQISESGLVVTNYHVVSSYIQFPEKNKITYESHTGEIGNLELVEFDVINDIALLKHPKPAKKFLKLSEVPLTKGEIIYALGNPSDFGIKLVSGPNNGFADHRYDDEILFSASLNGGMSGGPALNASGEVIGVNVSTAGGQLSFLVPVNKVVELVHEVEVVEEGEFQTEIARQIKQWQRKRLDELIELDWPVEEFSGKSLFGQIRSDFTCWGSTNEDDNERKKHRAIKSCSTGNVIYLSDDLDTGNITIWFRKLESIELNSMQFSETVSLSMSGNNNSNYETATSFECHTDFLENEKKDTEFSLINTCIRKYKKMHGLYDSLMRVDIVQNKQAYSAFFSLQGVEKDHIQVLNRKFIGKVL